MIAVERIGQRLDGGGKVFHVHRLGLPHHRQVLLGLRAGDIERVARHAQQGRRLLGEDPPGQLVAALAVLGTATCYALSALYAGRAVRAFPPLDVTIGQLGVGLLLALPFGLAQLPSEAPPAKAVAAIVALGALSTGVAYLLYFTLIARAGASRAILVTYLVPAFALVYGTVFLDEAVTVSALVGLVLILGGTALGTGARLRRG